MRTLIIISLFLIGSINAQEVNNTNQPNTINNQFESLYKKSGNYEIYKVIKKERFLNLQKIVNDSISSFKKELTNRQNTINSQNNTISALEEKINTLNSNVTSLSEKENSISLFGMQLSKASYNVVLWSLISALLAGLLFFIYKFNNSNIITKEAKKSLEESEMELEKQRKTSLEREQKLRRQLQDEINKQRGV